MKTVRISFFSILAFCLGGGLLTGERVFYLIVFMGCGVLLLSASLSLWTVWHFSYVQTVDKEEAVKGETVELTLRLYNDMPYPFTMMRVHIEAVTQSENLSYLFTLPPHSHIEWKPRFTCAFCGESLVGMSRVEIQDVFGLLRINFNMLRLPYYRMRPVLVFPRVCELGSITSHAPDEKNFTGGMSLTRHGQSFAGVREYQSGDALKRLHWKLYARTQKLFTRVYEVSAESHCSILIDARSQGLYGERFYYAADTLSEAAASIAYCALSSGYTVRVCVFGEGASITEGSSQRDFGRLNRALALAGFVKSERTDDFEELTGILQRLSGTGSAYLMTLGNAGELTECLKRMDCTFETVTVFAVGEAHKPTVNFGGLRELTVRAQGDVAAALEDLL